MEISPSWRQTSENRDTQLINTGSWVSQLQMLSSVTLNCQVTMSGINLIVFDIFFVFFIVFLLVISCIFITLIKCLKGHKSRGSIFEGVLFLSFSFCLSLSHCKWISDNDTVTYWAVLRLWCLNTGKLKTTKIIKSSSPMSPGGLEAANLGYSHLASPHTEILLDQSSRRATHACHSPAIKN